MAKKNKKPYHNHVAIKFLVGFIVTFVALAAFGLYLKHTDSKDCANSETCIQDLSGAYDSNEAAGVFMGKTVRSPLDTGNSFVSTPVLGENTDSKRIEIDLTNQRLYAFDGATKVYDFPVSTGKWAHTPTGTFKTWIKLRYTKMSGGNKALGTYYYLPNVPYTMYFYNDEHPKYEGYGIHGAYWHNNFGHPMSHGCVNMKEEDVAQVYAWASPYSDKNTTYASPENPGTTVIIYGETPRE